MYYHCNSSQNGAISYREFCTHIQVSQTKCDPFRIKWYICTLWVSDIIFISLLCHVMVFYVRCRHCKHAIIPTLMNHSPLKNDSNLGLCLIGQLCWELWAHRGLISWWSCPSHPISHGRHHLGATCKMFKSHQGLCQHLVTVHCEIKHAAPVFKNQIISTLIIW